MAGLQVSVLHSLPSFCPEQGLVYRHSGLAPKSPWLVMTSYIRAWVLSPAWPGCCLHGVKEYSDLLSLLGFVSSNACSVVCGLWSCLLDSLEVEYISLSLFPFSLFSRLSKKMWRSKLFTRCWEAAVWWVTMYMFRILFFNFGDTLCFEKEKWVIMCMGAGHCLGMLG